MSEVKVNKISPRTACGTVTLGDSGDTFTIPSGATITNAGTASGFGRTGTVDWQTDSIKTATFTATSGEGYFANTTSGVFNMNLPAGAAGSIVAVKDYLNTFDSNALTIVPNGSDKIGGTNSNYEVSTEALSLTLVYVDATRGWVDIHESTQASTGQTFVSASVSGACNSITTAPDCGNFKLATFLGPGTFTVCTVSAVGANNEVSYIIVAGGGAGGGANASSTGGAGGGGAGGFREKKSAIDTYTASPLDGATPITVTASGYPIAVGAGGTGVQGVAGNSGSTSTFSSVDSAGGGGGGGRAPAPGTVGNGLNGGSGGGGGFGTASSGSAGTGNSPPTSPAQGTNGAAYSSFETGSRPGGGGGATVAGSPAPNNDTGGAGGAGVATAISGASVTRAGGGGGGACTSGAGGPGGGGAGDPGPSVNAGDVNKGGGGGGTAGVGAPANTYGGAGGSGVVIIRYKFQ